MAKSEEKHSESIDPGTQSSATQGTQRETTMTHGTQSETTTNQTKAGGCCGGGACGQGEVEGVVQGREGDAGSGCCGMSGKNVGVPVEATIEQLMTLEPHALVRRYRRGVENFDRRVFEVTDEQLDMAFLADAGVGTWPLRVVLGHIADCELVYTHRMRRTAAEERPVLAVFDENALVDQNMYGLPVPGKNTPTPEFAGVGAMVAVTHVMRQWTGDWLRTLTSEQWERVALHPERGAESIKRMAAMATWHLEHHARFVNKKLDRLLGPAPAQEAGCCGGSGGGGCGCRQ
jgi:hypothetical protein